MLQEATAKSLCLPLVPHFYSLMTQLSLLRGSIESFISEFGAISMRFPAEKPLGSRLLRAAGLPGTKWLYPPEIELWPAATT